jgi:hypothetical protein
MKASGSWWCARSCVGKVRPGHINWVKDVQIVEWGPCTETVVCNLLRRVMVCECI